MKEDSLNLEPHQFNNWKKVLDYAMLIAKKMISCGAEIQRVEGTVATTVLGVRDGVDIVRVHDVKENLEAAMVADAIYRV